MDDMLAQSFLHVGGVEERRADGVYQLVLGLGSGSNQTLPSDLRVAQIQCVQAVA